MSFSGSVEMETEVVYEAAEKESESTIEPPMEEWSSLRFIAPEGNIKKILGAEGLYHPGSGEICTKYIAMSASSVFRHPIYPYLSVTDPGIKKALFDPPDVITYPDDGVELYATVCNEMKQCPVRIFQRGLLEEVIDLKYYCVNPTGVRAMAIALQYNRHVKILDFTDNFLTDDACYHLGQMLSSNACLRELNMSGCRIRPSGALRLFTGLIINRSLEVLHLNRNELGDMGIEHLANAVMAGVPVKKIYLSKNNIGEKGITALADALDVNNRFVVVDLSWNKLYVGLIRLLNVLSGNEDLQEVNLSWNNIAGARNGIAIKQLLTAPKLSHLDLSNNRLAGDATVKIIQTLPVARSLKTLDLSFNPIKPTDASNILNKMALPTVKLKTLIMKNVTVNQDFLETLDTMKRSKIKKDTVVIYGSVEISFKPKGEDPRDLLLNRAEYLTKKSKKATSNIALIALQLAKDKVTSIDSKLLYRMLMKNNVPLDADLVEELSFAFPGPRSGKGRLLNIELLVDFIKRKWPDEKLPPTPPPEPEPVPVKGKGKNAKGKGKK